MPSEIPKSQQVAQGWKKKSSLGDMMNAWEIYSLYLLYVSATHHEGNLF